MDQNESGVPESNAKACAPCRDAHQACDKGRPCGRCRHLDRIHLCCDPLPSTRKRGRPRKHGRNLPSSVVSYPTMSTSLPPSSSRCISMSALPAVGEEAEQYPFTTYTASSYSLPSAQMEEEPSLLAQYCYRCGVEFALPDAAFCMACGLKRALLPPFSNINNASALAEAPQQITHQHSSTASPCHDNYAGEPEDSALPFDIFSASSSSSFSSFPSSNNNIINLWLPPMAANTRRPSHSSMPYFSKAHLLECFVDNQLVEPWALLRPFAFDSNGGNVVALNSAFLKLSGYSQRELLGRSSRCLAPEELLEDMELMYDKLMGEWGNMRDCQVTLRDTCTIATKDGTWLMCHTTATAYFDVEEGGGPLCFSVQVKSATPVQKSVAIEQSKQSLGTKPWRVASRSLVPLPKDVRFHDGSVFAVAPLISLSAMEEYSSPCPSSSPSDSINRFASLPSFSTDLGCLTADTIDCEGSSSFRSDGSSSSPPSHSFAIDPYPQERAPRREPSSFNSAPPREGNPFW